MSDIELQVDGEQVDLIDTIRLRQTDPLPGGHRYRLTLRGSAQARFDRFGIKLAEPIPGAEQARVFFAIEGILATLPGEGQAPIRFILNTVDRDTRHSDGLTITGVASTPIL